MLLPCTCGPVRLDMLTSELPEEVINVEGGQAVCDESIDGIMKPTVASLATTA